MKVEYICRLCHLPGSVALNHEAESILSSLDQPNRDRIESLVKSLCHHNCWDIWWTCDDTERKLHRFSSIIASDESGKLREAVSPTIAKLVNRWVLNEYRRFGSRSNRASQDRIVTSIKNTPLAIVRILSDARDYIGGNQQDVT